MRIIGHVERGLYRDKFHNWVLANRQLPMLRLYLGNKSRHYNLFLMLRAWDEGNITTDFTESLINEVRENLVANGIDQKIMRETVYGLYREENEFMMTNYLDRVGSRTHLILRGEGQYENENESIAYQQGDIVIFEERDFGLTTRHPAEKSTIQMVTCWSNKTHPRNWELFADSLGEKTAWPGLGGQTFFMKEEIKQAKKAATEVSEE